MNRILFTLLVSLSAVLSSCNSNSNAAKRFEIDGLAEGTTYHIVYMDKEERILKTEIDSILEKFERSCSLYDSTSLISRINSNQTDTTDRYIKDCVNLALKLSRQSKGMYDITVAPLAKVYGFGAQLEPTPNPNIDSILQFVGYEKINLAGNIITKSDPRVTIDLNSIAKGYSVDLVAEYIRKQGVKDYLVEIGGEIYCTELCGDKPWRVGIDKPIEGNMIPGEELQTIIEIGKIGLATSGNYRKFYTAKDGTNIHHTINPKTGLCTTNNLLSASVLAPTTAEADGYATLFMAVGLEESKKILSKNPNLYGYLIYSNSNGTLSDYTTPNLASKIVE